MNDIKNATETTSAKAHDPKHSGMVVRETIESFAVALILAFLFRAFVAEAFVIPTGSMAPTLMGAHKDIQSAETGFQFQCGASSEFETETGRRTSAAVVGATCPLSRYEQAMELKKDWNHKTFSGDRILVSKFSYLLSDPKRWDVIVFKFEGNARQNYIKRCVGLPNETLRIQQGDIYVRPEGQDRFSIARKPPNVVQAMLQPVADSKYVSKTAVKAGVPSAWQPSPESGEGNLGWTPSDADSSYTNAWTVEQSEENWTAKYKATADDKSIDWIRYYHRILTPLQWNGLRANGKLPAPIPPYSSRLITDYTSYNAPIFTDRRNVYDEKGRLVDNYQSDWLPSQVRDSGGVYSRTLPVMNSSNWETDGKHWAGDLATEFDLEIESGRGNVVLDLVEGGIHYQCSIDVGSGVAKLTARANQESLAVFENASSDPAGEAIGTTAVRAGSRQRLKFANVDNTLHLWVNGDEIAFQPSNRVMTDSSKATSRHQPTSTKDDPLDAAPIGLGLSGVSATLHRARVWRDIYYIADKGAMTGLQQREDNTLVQDLKASLTDDAIRGYLTTFFPNVELKEFTNEYALFRDILYSTPSLWSASPLFSEKPTVDFDLGDDEFFPMGDNSVASSDARIWSDHYRIPNALPRRLLIGRAVVVFWPHAWMAPIPFLPNIGRMGLIR